MFSRTCTDEGTRGSADVTRGLGQEVDGQTSIIRDPSVALRQGVRFEHGKMQD